VQISDIADLADGLTGVRETQSAGLAQWRYRGRLVARQLDNAHVAIRADFDDRDEILREFPETLSVPTRPPSTRWSSQTWPTTIRQPSRMPSKPPLRRRCPAPGSLAAQAGQGSSGHINE
jgi:hypothetical protein